MNPKPHLDLAFEYWKTCLLPGDTVIDATCGNGKDTLRLASLVPQGKVLALDIQEDAIIKAKKLTAAYSNVFFFLQSHASFPPSGPIKLVVYNLGYLPFGNKSLTTMTATTLQSLEMALLKAQAISITCYPGHPEGLVEKEAVFAWAKTLAPNVWKVFFHEWKETSPCLVFVKKIF